MAALMPRLCRAMMRREISCVSAARASAQQIWALEIIRDHEACSQRLLLDTLQLKASTGTVFVDRLAKSGLVKRTTNPRNRRAVLLSITRRGEAMLHKAELRRKKEAKRLFVTLSREQRDAYIQLIESLLDTLKH